jgi:hypothetical protein
MILSDEFPFTFRSKPAKLRVVRNNAYCWAEAWVTVSSNKKTERYSISTRADHYDEADEEAAEAFIRAARNPRCVSESLINDHE